VNALSRRYTVLGPERAELTLTDGVVLVADIWRPDSGEDFPILLMRQPYGRTIASTVVFAHPTWYAARGYVVVIQDVRGTGDSGGEFDALANEAADGARTLEWAASLPGSNGRIGTYGFSYQGVTQYLALAGGGRRPDAMSPAMAPWSIRNDWAYEGNAFRRTLGIGWAVQMAWLKATRNGDTALAAELRRETDPGRLEALVNSRSGLSHLARWQADDDAYWARISPDRLLAGDPLGIPVLHIGGWADYMLGGTLAADAAFRARKPGTTHLVLGPWAHIPWNRSAGSSDMGPAAEYSVDRLQLRFFDFYLKGCGGPPVPVEFFDIGRREWTSSASRPALPMTSLYLRSTGLAATLLSDGELTETPGEDETDIVVHDPSNPAPLIGGALGVPSGFADRARADDRADVAVYATAPFENDVFFGGAAVLELDIQASAAPFNLCASLSMVTPSGSAIVLRTVFTRQQQRTARLTIRFDDLYMTIRGRHGLRLSLQGAGIPVFEAAHDVGPMGQPRPIRLTIWHGGTASSQLHLPVSEGMLSAPIGHDQLQVDPRRSRRDV
jgi:putative CocE/NonD family hydrolase